MSTAWARTTKMVAAVALMALGSLAIGCGPAPGYEPEPRVPVNYAPVGDTSVEAYPEPATSEELQARADARQAEADTQGEIAVGAQTDEYADTDPTALTEFKPALDGHGTWVDDPTYGTVWVPSEAEVGTDFVPYTTAGHWTYADDTNYVWVSDYSWGWAPFHYGRWARIGHHGWAWIPGRTYAGAWVTWRTGPGYDYVGWSPAGPDWYWYNGYAVGWTFGYSPYYSYCRHDYLYSPYVGRYSVRGNDPRVREHEARTQPYVGARPGVAPGARVAANPSVGPGGGRIAATPGVGPRPSEIGIHNGIVAPPSDNAGLARARALASPATAVAHGAAPPAALTRRRTDVDAVVTAPGTRGFDSPRSPAMSNRFDAAARAPQVGGVAPSPSRPSASSPSYDARGSSRSLGASDPRTMAPGSSNPVQQAPTRVLPSSPSVHPSYSQSAPAYRPSPSSPTPSPRSAPSFSQSAPTYRSAPSISSPPPSFRSAPSAPSMRSAPSYSAPAVRSAPAPAPARPSSSPSRPATRSRR